ncbi:hypothetical protein [Streptomyces sp. NPDC101145]|uniref:hypothetical protein n=1 Tax=Streptomyces sp. NPDC101145 TaxID=3366112 RepID=UPI003811EEAC
MPETSAVPQFAPLRVREGRFRLRRTAWNRRRAAAAGLAMTAAALAASGLREAGSGAGPEARRVVDPVAVRAAPPGSAAAPVGAPRPGRRASPDVVAVPVRIADGAAVRLLRPGDRVDVIAVPFAPAGTAADDGGPAARVVATGVRVRAVPGAGADAGAGQRPGGASGTAEGSARPWDASTDGVGSVPAGEGDGSVPAGEGDGSVPAMGGEGNPPDPLDAWGDAGQSGGALLVLAVPRTAAAGLVAAAATSRLAVVLC